MKKMVCLVMAIVLCFALCACEGRDGERENASRRNGIEPISYNEPISEAEVEAIIQELIPQLCCDAANAYYVEYDEILYSGEYNYSANVWEITASGYFEAYDSNYNYMGGKNLHSSFVIDDWGYYEVTRNYCTDAYEIGLY